MREQGGARSAPTGPHLPSKVSFLTSSLADNRRGPRFGADSHSVERGSPGTPVSAGYDRIRFTRPVFAGDALTARYVVEEVDDAHGRPRARVEVVNGEGETCLVGTRILAWVTAPG